MPAIRRTNLSRRTRNAARQRNTRASETDEQREARNEVERNRWKCRCSKMPQSKRKAIGQVQPKAKKVKQRRRRESPEERERRLAKQRESTSKYRASETEEQREARLQSNRERAAKARAQRRRAARLLGTRERPAEQRKVRVFPPEVKVKEELQEGVNREIDTYPEVTICEKYPWSIKTEEIDTYAQCLICEDYPVSVKTEETAPDGDYPDENDPLYIRDDESDPLYIRDDEGQDGEEDITHSQHPSTAPEVSPRETTCGGVVRVAVRDGWGGEAPVGTVKWEGEAAPDSSGRAPPAGVSAEAALLSCRKSGESAIPEWVIQQRKRQRAPRYSVRRTNLLAAYEGKQMVCPACRRSFLGVSALQRHIAAQHGGRAAPHPAHDRWPVAAQSSASKQSRSYLDQLPTSTTRVTGAGSGPTECGEAVASSVPDTPADSTGPSRPQCCKLLAGEEALAAHVMEEQPHSEVPTGCAPSAPGCGERGGGLKTQISTALGGLLGRAFASLRKKELCGGRAGSCRDLAPGPLPLPSPSPLMSLPPGSRPYIQRTPQLAEQARRLLAEDLQAVGAGRGSSSRRYACFYCERRFEQQCTRNRHMRHQHRDDVVSPVRAQAESEDDPEREPLVTVHEDPLETSRSDDSQEDADLKFGVAATENNVHEDPLVISKSDDSKEDTDLKCGVIVTENKFQFQQ